jgi:RNA polymerase sigma-70 factor (ECF subfamily)
VPVEPVVQDDQFAELTDPYRSELLAHCYRLVGSLHDAEDLVQETLVRAWRGYGNFDGRSSLRTWLYRIATNTCLTALGSTHRRVLPSGLGPGTEDSAHAHLQRADHVPWLEPVPTADLIGAGADPAAVVALRDSTRLALIAAFQALPARQRAVLILVDVVGYAPAEVADLLDITVTASRSLLQRARATIADKAPAREPVSAPQLDADLLHRYLQAFEAADTAAIAKLLKADVEYEMPPHSVWFLGRDAVLDHHARRVFTHPHRARPTSANGYPALATYSRTADGSFAAHGIQVLEPEDGLIARVTVFLDEELFAGFGLPLTLPA